MSKTTRSKLIICKSCKGSGKIEHSELEDYHNNISSYWDEPCTNCGGLGRLKKTTTKTTEKITEKDLKLRKKE